MGNPTDDMPFTPGDRVELTGEPPDYASYALTVGSRGTVRSVDSLKTVHVRWDNGSQVGIIAELTGLLRWCRHGS